MISYIKKEIRSMLGTAEVTNTTKLESFTKLEPWQKFKQGDAVTWKDDYGSFHGFVASSCNVGTGLELRMKVITGQGFYGAYEGKELLVGKDYGFVHEGNLINGWI